MKIKFTLLMCLLASFASMNSQIMLNEVFTAPFNAAASGWYNQNNSVPQGTVSWFQGDSTTFPSYNGAANDYYAVNYLSQDTTSGGISNWLVTPTVSLTNGGVLNFATRTVINPATYPDRLQVLMSFGTGTGAIGAGTTAVGTFTALLTDINPGLTATGYPDVWTVYSLTLSTVPGTVAGRFAFRYFVDDGGLNGLNSNYIGIDAVNYIYPCVQPTITVTPGTPSICSGATTTLTATGGASYTWSPGGQLTNTIAANPSVTTIYTVIGSSSLNCPGTQTVSVNVTTTPTLSVNNVTTCAGTSVALIANGAASYSWQPGGQLTSSISAPGNAATYTVIGNNGSCGDTAIVSVVISSSLGLIASASPSVICNGDMSNLSVSGANSYTWSTGSNNNSIIVTPTTNTTYSVIGLTGTCSGSTSINIVVNPNPTVTGVSNPSMVCIGSDPSFTLTASGALNYTWTILGNTFTGSPQAFLTPTTANVYNFDLNGQDANGCNSATITIAVTVTNCNVGIQTNSLESSEISAYPNPFSNELKIMNFKGRVEIYNIAGQMVMNTVIDQQETINTGTLPKGNYIVKALNADGTIHKTLKVLKN